MTLQDVEKRRTMKITNPNNYKYRVYVDEFTGCMGHYDKYVYDYYETYEEAKKVAKEVEESDDCHWISAYVEEVRLETIVKEVWETK